MEVREPPASYSEYMALPADGPRYEIIGGVGYLTPAPGSLHQIVSSNLQYLFSKYIRENDLRLVIPAPFDVILSETDVVQPDLSFITRPRLHLLKAKGLFGPPDLVVEVFSPSTGLRDCQEKLALYTRHGVREYWLVDPANHAVEQWVSLKAPLDERKEWRDGAVASRVLPGFAPVVGEIFGGIEGIEPE